MEELSSQAFELKKTGATYRQIGVAMGVSGKTAHGYVKRAIEHIHKHLQLSGEQWIQLELERLEAARRAIAAQVSQGKLGAVREWREIGKAERELLGLDAPKRQEIEFPEGIPIKAYIGIDPEDV